MSRLTLIIICFFLILLISLFLIWPKYQELRALKVEVEEKETEFRYLEEYFSKLNQLSQELKKYEAQLSKIDFALPSDSSLTLLSLMNFLQKASSQNGLVFKEFSSFSIILPKPLAEISSPQESQLPSGIKEIYLNFEVAGSYSALKNFLNTLEKSAKLIEVEDVSFSFGEEEIFSFGLKIKTHSY
ncbi:type 4a pilus biogenesis protein PilO [Patescibacteria group bacterium]|nr:type 4a pilus biogenesis protein PilO [Patescibacteria group bacterium]